MELSRVKLEVQPLHSHTFAHMLARVFMLEHPMHINPQAYRVVDQQSQLQAHKVSTSTRLVVVRATFQDVNVVGAGANEDALHAQQIKTSSQSSVDAIDS